MHVRNSVFMADREGVLLVPYSLVTNVTITKKTLENNSYRTPNHVCVTKPIKGDLGFP